MESKRGFHPSVKRPMILDVLPADQAPRLDVLPKVAPSRTPQGLFGRIPRTRALIAAALIVATGAILLLIFWWGRSPSAQLPQSIAKQISGFTPYFYGTRLPDDFQLNEKSINYTDGVLFFQVHNTSGNNVVISEQPLPSAYALDGAQASSRFAVAHGQAAVSRGDGRTVGTLITAVKPQALVSLRGGDWISAAMMEDLVKALAPTKN